MFTDKVKSLLDEKIESKEEYVSWVRKWKKLHQQMVSNIIFLKSDTKRVGFSTRDINPDKVVEKKWDQHCLDAIVLMGHNQHNLAGLRITAKDMYDARVTHKDLLKKGVYPQLVLHMDGDNSKNAEV